VEKGKDILDAPYAKAMKSGETYAFDYFFNKYAKIIYQFTLSFLKSEADSEELVQEIFIKLWDRRKNINPQRSFRAYLFTIAINSIRDFFNIKAKENKFKLELYDFLLGEKNEQEEINFHLYLKILDEQIELLPDKRKEIFIMHKKEGLTITEIAGILKISPKTAENQLASAVKTIRDAFYKKNLKGLYLFLFLNLYH